jgi:hypothetical protein
MRDLTTEERADIQFILNHTRNDPSCQNIKSTLQGKLDSGAIKAYTGQEMRATGDMHTQSGEIHLFEPRGRGATELGWTVLHEGAHFHGYSAEWIAESQANYCWMGD